MKKWKSICLVLIVLCLAAFYGYRAVDRITTDTQAPQITMSGQLQVSVGDPKTALLQGVTAQDKKDGDVTASVLVERVRLVDSDGTVNVTYAAFDKAGNVAKAERQVQYIDYESPRFTLNGPLAFQQNSGFDVLSVVSVEDMLDGDITHRVRAASVDKNSITSLGTHDVEFRVTNSLGQTVKLCLPVEVYPAGTYQGSLELTDYLIYLPVGTRCDAKSYLGKFTQGTDTTVLNGSLPGDFSLRTTGSVDTGTPGVYSVAYEVTYNKADGVSSAYTGYSKLIVVVEG